MTSFTHKAMATDFEIRFPPGDKDYQAKAAQACFAELGRLEGELSRFVESSDVRRVASLQPRAPCPVGIDFFECFKISLRVYQETHGAFDPSFGKMGLLAVQPDDLTVWVKEEGILLDFGALGKGYALDVMASLLIEWGLHSFLLQGGESSALGYHLKSDAGEDNWAVSLRDPRDQKSVLSTLALKNRSLGGSGQDLNGEHILDPRTGKPAKKRPAAWALAPLAAHADAYSTAFMVMEEDEIRAVCEKNSHISGLVMRDNGELVRFGSWPAIKEGVPS